MCAMAGSLVVASMLSGSAGGAPSFAVQAEHKPVLKITWAAPVNHPQLLEAIAAQLEPYREDIPLDRELQAALREACQASGVPMSLALGLIEVESGFRADAVGAADEYGLCQLNPKYFPADLTSSENIAAGVGYLGELMSRYETVESALTAYNAGSDTGDRTYANAVLAAAEKWRKP